MVTDKIELPSHFPLVASELNKLSRRIQQELLSPPAMNLPERDFSEVLARFEEQARPAIDGLIEAFQDFSARILTAGMEPTDEEVLRVMEALGQQLDELLDFHHYLWQSPFPAGHSAGQYLLSAIFERPLRDILVIFDSLEAIMDDPEAAVEKYGGTVIRLDLELNAKEECQAFADWCDGIKAAEETRRRQASNSFMNLAAAFLFGWWWGHD